MNVHSPSASEADLALCSAHAVPPPDPKEAREAEILESIRTTFAAKGFDGASMQELARAAGMSVGNFYRYFPSKAAMVEAIIRRDIADVEVKFAEVLGAADPQAALRKALHERVAEECSGCVDGVLWAEINAVAARKSDIAAVVRTKEAEVTTFLIRAFGHMTGLSAEAAQDRFGSHAAMLVMLVKATAIQGRLHADQPHRDGLLALIHRIIDVILSEVASARAER